jgi:speckle-type POZ protein
VEAQEPTTAEPITVASPDLHRHLGEFLLTNKEGGDVTFEVGGKTFSAHKCILDARSSLFKAELFGPVKEEVTDYLLIDDMASKVFKALLHFVYTDLLVEMDPEEDN